MLDCLITGPKLVIFSFGSFPSKSQQTQKICIRCAKPLNLNSKFIDCTLNLLVRRDIKITSFYSRDFTVHRWNFLLYFRKNCKLKICWKNLKAFWNFRIEQVLFIKLHQVMNYSWKISFIFTDNINQKLKSPLDIIWILVYTKKIASFKFLFLPEIPERKTNFQSKKSSNPSNFLSCYPSNP